MIYSYIKLYHHDLTFIKPAFGRVFRIIERVWADNSGMMGSDFLCHEKVSSRLDDNTALIRRVCGSSTDIVLRPVVLANGQRAAVFMIDGLADSRHLGRDLLAPLTKADKEGCYSAAEIARSVLSLTEISLESEMQVIIESVLQGLTALFLDGAGQAVCMQAIDWPQRSVEEPGTDVVIRGPREGFIEAMRPNVALLRRKIHHPDFRVETHRLGRYSRTDVAVVYVSGIVNEGVLSLVRKRLAGIDIDAILDSGSVEQLLQDAPGSLFPTVGIAEKPDIAAARILEGRVCLVVDGSPVVLTVPMLFVEGLHSPEDYYTNYLYSSWIRIIRTLAFLLSLWLPGFFVASVRFHQETVPLKLLLSMSEAEFKTPFSTGLSLLIISLVYEILREAGIRLPKPAGQAVSIVGAIIMGDAAVSANLISTPVLIVLAFTVVASFVSATYLEASTLPRLLFLLLGWAFGMFGLMLGAMAMLVYLCSLESFGVPYFAPIAPLELPALKDALLRFPVRSLDLRPSFLSRNRRRMSTEHEA